MLFQFDEGPKPRSMMNVAFRTDDVEGTYGAEPTKKPWGTFAIFKDADANTFVLGTK